MVPKQYAKHSGCVEKKTMDVVSEQQLKHVCCREINQCGAETASEYSSTSIVKKSYQSVWWPSRNKQHVGCRPGEEIVEEGWSVA